MYRGFLQLAYAVFLAGAVGACAGDLRHPERFNGAIRKYLGEDKQAPAGATGDAGPAMDATNTDESDGGSASDTSATGGDATNGAPPDTAAPDCALAIFAKSCALVGCHAKGTKTQIDLGSDGVGDRLINQQSTSKTCGGRTFIATDGSASLLIDKLSADPPPCGSKMPVGSKLSDADMQCLNDWVGSLSAQGDSGDTQ